MVAMVRTIVAIVALGLVMVAETSKITKIASAVVTRSSGNSCSIISYKSGGRKKGNSSSCTSINARSYCSYSSGSCSKNTSNSRCIPYIHNCIDDMSPQKQQQ